MPLPDARVLSAASVGGSSSDFLFLFPETTLCSRSISRSDSVVKASSTKKKKDIAKTIYKIYDKMKGVALTRLCTMS